MFYFNSIFSICISKIEMSEKAVKVVADEVNIRVKCKGKEKGEKASDPAPGKRKASEKQLEHLKKAREKAAEAKAAKKAAEGGTPKSSTSKAAPKASTSKAAEPKDEPKPSTFDFDELRDRARAAADKVISIKMLQTIFLGIGKFAQIEKHNREQAAEMFSRVLSDLKITKRKGVFVSGGHALTEKQSELLIKAIGIALRKKYLESKEAQEDEKDERSKDRPTQIGNTLIAFHTDDKSMKDLFKFVKTS
jgi:hypothetical protein